MCGLLDHFDLVGQKSRLKSNSKLRECQLNLFEWLRIYVCLLRDNSIVMSFLRKQESKNPLHYGFPLSWEWHA